MSGDLPMSFVRNTSDLHMHLNGSLTLKFLEDLAIKNGPEAIASYKELVSLRIQYDKLRAQLLAGSEAKEPLNLADQCEKLIWKQFPLIHKIMTKMEDIYEGTLNVVEASKASYMEIRTTPKGTDQPTRQEYINTFVRGLNQANKKFSGSKAAFGLLSLDRSSCTPETAYEIVDAVVAEKARSGLLVGIDLGGNYLAPRKLTGEELAKVLKYALSKDIGLALHVGEINSVEEKNDVDIILKTLADWQKLQPGSNPFQGKVRLGHGIFFTPLQIEMIQNMQLPLEICPACHEKLNWWKPSEPHPVTSIYKTWQDPVIPATDDELFFGQDAKAANQQVLDLLSYPQGQNRGMANTHHAKFRFTPQPETKASSSRKQFMRNLGFFALGASIGAAIGGALLSNLSTASKPQVPRKS
jgi:adenosine deaminase